MTPVAVKRLPHGADLLVATGIGAAEVDPQRWQLAPWVEVAP